ncbi:hypothetical protein DQ384_21925 [Sphaerisporangium album]|uniref:Uncharacterized protein n=1 Tax=Sphaerisporangium album TaxID=509200 RepID=A0A367FFE4_9ACTN|nr:hypothetical protein DQ384_21925 [Sphaerisporangium album]
MGGGGRGLRRGPAEADAATGAGRGLRAAGGRGRAWRSPVGCRHARSGACGVRRGGRPGPLPRS